MLEKEVGEIGSGLVWAGGSAAKVEQMTDDKRLLYAVPTIAFGFDSGAERIISKLLNVYSATDSTMDT